MGNWNINIQGIGCHHNQNAEIDANLSAEDLVRVLRKQGHTVESATFTSGVKDDLLANVDYKDAQPTDLPTCSPPTA